MRRQRMITRDTVKISQWLPRLTILVCLSVLAALAQAADSAPHALTHSKDLSRLASAAQAEGVPVLLMFSAPHCDYCQRLEREVLAPMAQGQERSPQVLMAKVESGAGLLRDFNGQRLSADALADAYDIDVYPTLVLVDARGQALVPKIVGYQTPEFYPAYLELEIKTGQALLRR